MVIFHNFLWWRSIRKIPSTRIALRASTTVAGGLRGLACRKILRRRPLTRLEVLWRFATPDTRVRGVPPSRTAPPPAPGGGKRTRGVYGEGILLWVWPGCCSKVFLWADLTQPGGEVHWSKPVCAKSKG